MRHRSKGSIAATLAIVVVLGFLGVFIFLATGKIPPENKDYFNTALIALIGFAGTAIGYYLGSSQGSSDKNVLLDRIAAPPAVPGSQPPPTETKGDTDAKS